MQDGTVYVGQWKEKRRSGHGKAYFKDGSLYEGSWKSNV